MLHPKADELLVKICKAYVRTGLTELPSIEITTDPMYESFFPDLVANGYIDQKNDVNETIVLLAPAIQLSLIHI